MQPSNKQFNIDIAEVKPLATTSRKNEDTSKKRTTGRLQK